MKRPQIVFEISIDCETYEKLIKILKTLCLETLIERCTDLLK